MTSVDELLAWLRAPLQELATERADSPDTPWDELRTSFLARTGLHDSTEHPLVDQLLNRLDAMSAEERDATLADSGTLEAHAYEVATQVGGQHGGDDQPAGQTYDEGAWQQFLAENGPRWSGEAESWDQFSEWFVYHANESGLGTPASALIQHLAAQAAPDRIATFAQYGVRIAAGQSHDEGAWQQFLAENGPRWSGEAESWSQFSEWFRYQANESGVGTPASALLDQLNAMPVPDRIATLAQHGVTIATPPGQAQPVQLSEEQVQSLLEQTAEFDDIPEKRRRELIQLAAEGM